MKKIIIFSITLIVGFSVFYLNRNNTDHGNLIILPILLIFAIPLVKFLFPASKEMGIGTIDFYPNLFHKAIGFFKKKK